MGPNGGSLELLGLGLFVEQCGVDHDFIVHEGHADLSQSASLRAERGKRVLHRGVDLASAIEIYFLLDFLQFLIRFSLRFLGVLDGVFVVSVYHPE